MNDLEIVPGARGALERLRAAGFSLVVVTNQPDVARGLQRREVVDAMHAHLASILPINDFRLCLHDDADGCMCRKPNPGMLEAAADELSLNLSASFMVGDRWRDVEAGRRAGCTTVFIDAGYREQQPEAPDAIVKSLVEAADWILTATGSGAR